MNKVYLIYFSLSIAGFVSAGIFLCISVVIFIKYKIRKRIKDIINIKKFQISEVDKNQHKECITIQLDQNNSRDFIIEYDEVYTDFKDYNN